MLDVGQLAIEAAEAFNTYFVAEWRSGQQLQAKVISQHVGEVQAQLSVAV